MIIALVTFPAPPESPGDLRALLEATAPAYRDIDGLRRKYFIGNERVAGGVYEWRDRDSAERYYDANWRRKMTERYGAEPVVELFRAPCLVDNVGGEIVFEGV